MELLLVSLQLLLHQGDRLLVGVHLALELLVKLGQLHLKAFLRLIALLLLVQELVLVFDLSLGQSLLSILLLFGESLVETLLFGIVELLELQELGLRVGVDFSDSVLLGSFLLLKEFIALSQLLIQSLNSVLVVPLLLGELLLALSPRVVALFLSEGEVLAQALDLLLRVFGEEGQLKLHLGEILSQVADRTLALLDLLHVRVAKLLNLILVRLAELVNLVLGLLLADDGLALTVLETLEDSFMVQLHLVLLSM